MKDFVKLDGLGLCLILLVTLVCANGGGARGLGLDSSLDIGPRKCERITIPMCLEMPYNTTRMPNLLGHFSQGQAAIQVHEFMPLVDIGCSNYLRFFLCSIYAPMCTPVVGTAIPSCRSICLEVRAKCLPVLRTFNFTWPAALNCSRLPTPEGDGLCMEYPNITSSKPTIPPARERPWAGVSPIITPPSRLPQETSCPHRQMWVATKEGGVCTPKCGQDVFFRRADKHFAEVWLLVWAGLCFLSTLFTVLTFWLEPARFRYPERTIICLSLCYLLYCLAYLARMVVPSEVLSCERLLMGCNILPSKVYIRLDVSLLSSCSITLAWHLASGGWF